MQTSLINGRHVEYLFGQVGYRYILFILRISFLEEKNIFMVNKPLASGVVPRVIKRDTDWDAGRWQPPVDSSHYHFTRFELLFSSGSYQY